jgi:hypothetical protein
MCWSGEIVSPGGGEDRSVGYDAAASQTIVNGWLRITVLKLRVSRRVRKLPSLTEFEAASAFMA